MTYLEFHRLIIVLALAAVRIGAAFMICPAFGEAMISGMARRAAILAFSLLVVPHVLATMPPGEPNWSLLVVVGLKEVVIGFLIGFFAAVPFWIAENVGNFIDNQRGATMGEVYSPLSGSQESTTGLFFSQIVSTVFFVSGAVFLLLAYWEPLAFIANGFRNITSYWYRYGYIVIAYLLFLAARYFSEVESETPARIWKAAFAAVGTLLLVEFVSGYGTVSYI